MWPGAGMVADRKSIVEKTDLEEEDLGGFPVNSPDCMVLDQSINDTWIGLKYGGLNEKFQKRKPSRRTNGGFINDVHSSWSEMKIDHIRNAIDAQRNVMLQIIERKGGQQHFLLQMQQNQLTNRARGNQMSSVDNLFKKLFFHWFYA